jgi:hypothetical protein
MTFQKRTRFDRILVGWLIGTIMPIIIFLIFYMVKCDELDIQVYVKNLWRMKIFFKIMYLCILPNLGYFLYFIRQKYDMAARGVILATFIYTFIVLIAKSM